MKTVTLEQFLTFGPCWLEEEGGRDFTSSRAYVQSVR